MVSLSSRYGTSKQFATEMLGHIHHFKWIFPIQTSICLERYSVGPCLITGGKTIKSFPNGGFSGYGLGSEDAAGHVYWIRAVALMAGLVQCWFSGKLENNDATENLQDSASI